MKGVEFYNSAFGGVVMTDGCQQINITPKDNNIIDELIDLIKDNYIEAYNALDTCYAKSKMNPSFHRYKMATRFIRCNCGVFDTMLMDIDTQGLLHLEQVPCPLRGTGDCPYENIICMPTKTCQLSARQFELASLLALGQSNNEIADQMCISINTVHNIINIIKSKLKISHTGEIVTWYNNYVQR